MMEWWQWAVLYICAGVFGGLIGNWLHCREMNKRYGNLK